MTISGVHGWYLSSRKFLFIVNKLPGVCHEIIEDCQYNGISKRVSLFFLNGKDFVGIIMTRAKRMQDNWQLSISYK